MSYVQKMFGKRTSKSSDAQYQSFEQSSSEEEQQKLSSRQKLIKLFLVSDIKNPKFRKPLRAAKAEMIRNFHDGGFDAHTINALFRVYFYDHKDVFVPKHLQSLLSRYKVFVPGIPTKRVFTLREYLTLLAFVREQFEPTMKQLFHYQTLAREYAQQEIAKDQGIAYTYYDCEQEQELYHMFAQKKFRELMKTPLRDDFVAYDEAWISQQQSFISSWPFSSEKLRALAVFAIFAFHYFQKPGLIYQLFSSEQLQQTAITIPFSHAFYQPISLTLEEFLFMLQYLDFKHQVFSL